jgi:hypothetical protein
MRNALVVAVSLLLLCACATTAPPPSGVSMFGPVEDQQRLAGVWRGTYDSVDDRTDGDVTLRFTPGSDSVGNMTLESRNAPTRVLWVRLAGREITGAFEPYVDPACSCTVYATFTATVDGDEMRGQVRHRVGMNWSDAGTWVAMRVRE